MFEDKLRQFSDPVARVVWHELTRDLLHRGHRNGAFKQVLQQLSDAVFDDAEIVITELAGPAAVARAKRIMQRETRPGILPVRGAGRRSAAAPAHYRKGAA